MVVPLQVIHGGRAGILQGDMSVEDLETTDLLVREYGAYRLTTEGTVLKPGMGIGEGIPVDKAPDLSAAGTSFIRARVLNNSGTELIYPPRFDISVKADELLQAHGCIYGRPALSDLEQPTFRGLYTVIDRSGVIQKAEGDASVELCRRVQELQAKRFIPVVQQLFGTRIVVPKMLFANMLLPGQEITMHHDVPEFRGIHPRSCPNWLQCVMHASGLFTRWRILQAAALTYFQDIDRGSLAVYSSDDQGEGIVIPARRGLGVVLEAETLPHHSDLFLGRQLRQTPKWPKGVRLQHQEALRCWTVKGPDGQELARYASEEVRVSTQMKLHCFRDEAEKVKYFDHSDDLSVEAAIETLTADLRRRGWFDGTSPPRADLAVMMIKEYIRWPTPDTVAKCWASLPESVFAQAFAGTSSAASIMSSGPQRARL